MRRIAVLALGRLGTEGIAHDEDAPARLEEPEHRLEHADMRLAAQSDEIGVLRQARDEALFAAGIEMHLPDDRSDPFDRKLRDGCAEALGVLFGRERRQAEKPGRIEQPADIGDDRRTLIDGGRRPRLDVDDEQHRTGGWKGFASSGPPCRAVGIEGAVFPLDIVVHQVGAEAPNIRIRPVCSSSSKPVACAKQSTISMFAICRDAPRASAASAIGRRRSFQRRVQFLVAGVSQSRRLHAAAEQIEAEIEIAGVFRIVPEEGHRRGREASASGSRVLATASSTAPPSEAREAAQHLGIDRFLRIEMEVERRRRVAGPHSDRAQARAFEAFAREHLPGRIQDQVPLVFADRLLFDLRAFAASAPDIPFLTTILTVLDNSNTV